jgi:hypothetical protein
LQGVAAGRTPKEKLFYRTGNKRFTSSGRRDID